MSSTVGGGDREAHLIVSSYQTPSLGNLSNPELCFVISFSRLLTQRRCGSICGAKVLASFPEGLCPWIFNKAGNSPKWGWNWVGWFGSATAWIIKLKREDGQFLLIQGQFFLLYLLHWIYVLCSQRLPVWIIENTFCKWLTWQAFICTWASRSHL